MQQFRSKLREIDFGVVDTATIAGTYVKLGEYQVKAGEIVFPGFGNIRTQSDALGRIYGVFKNATAAELKGMLRISVHSPQDYPLAVLAEYRTEDLNTSATVKGQQTPFEFLGIGASEDKKIVLEFKCDATDTIEADNVSLLMDITRRLI